MATRFYCSPSTAAPGSLAPAFDAGWEQTGQAVRRMLFRKLTLPALEALADSTAITVPITTTQDILCAQFLSEPIPPQQLIGTVSLVVRAIESASTANVTLAVVVKVVDQQGANQRTIFSTFNTDTEFGTTAATRIVTAQAVTTTITQPGDRLLVEVGGHAAGPTAGTTYTMRFGSNAASDFALTSALTTDLNPWIELSQDIWAGMPTNFQRASGTLNNAGILSFGERVR